jgi:DNA-binding NarL/FixJ family response regulator
MEPAALRHHDDMPTILICEDHPMFRLEARWLLEAQGFSVIGEAEDGATALVLAVRDRPDVLLLDIGLPDVEGFALAEQLASLEPATCIVLTSSREEAAYGSRVRESAAAGFIRKDELSGDAIRSLMRAR